MPSDTSQMTVVMFMGSTEITEGGCSQLKTTDLSPSWIPLLYPVGTGTEEVSISKCVFSICGHPFKNVTVGSWDSLNVFDQ